MLYANFTVTEKDSGALKVGQIVRIKVDAYPGRTFEGKITTIEPQIATDTRNIRVQATIANPDKILKPGMFATTTVVLPDKPAVVTVPETAVDYTLYGDSVFLITEKKEDDGKTSLVATRTFVQTGNRIEGRAEILKGLKPGDRVVAVGQLKLQSGRAVTISTDPAPPIPAQAAALLICSSGQANRPARNQAAMAFTDIFIKRPVLSVVVSLLILLIGLRAATILPIRQYPKLSNTVVNVTTVYPGASAALISGFITTPIEQAVASAEGVDYITSSSVQGTSTIQVYIKLNFDPNQALTEVLAKVNSVKYLIPRESNDPIVTKTTGQTTAVMYLGFSSEELSGSAISDYLTRVVQPVLSTVDGVASADILGGQTFAMRLWLDPVKMAGRNISAE